MIASRRALKTHAGTCEKTAVVPFDGIRRDQRAALTTRLTQRVAVAALCGSLVLGSGGSCTLRQGELPPSSQPRPDEDVTREDLARFVRSRAGSLRECYEQVLRQDPEARGQVVVILSITPAGEAADVAVESNNFPTDAVAACVVPVVKAWRFPFRPTSDVTVAYPFVFSPAAR
ncbi:MAG: AgmX/PglI C-terminal domain-containing protein [Myxococcaceae bacterium]